MLAIRQVALRPFWTTALRQPHRDHAEAQGSRPWSSATSPIQRSSRSSRATRELRGLDCEVPLPRFMSRAGLVVFPTPLTNVG
jgi:hypothetical protein